MAIKDTPYTPTLEPHYKMKLYQGHPCAFLRGLIPERVKELAYSMPTDRA